MVLQFLEGKKHQFRWIYWTSEEYICSFYELSVESAFYIYCITASCNILLVCYFCQSIWITSVLLCSNFSFVHKMVYRYLWCSSIYLSETDRGPFWYCWQFQGQQLFASSKVIYFDTWRSLVQCITQGLISMRVWLTYILVAYLSGSIGLNETCKWTKMG